MLHGEVLEAATTESSYAHISALSSDQGSPLHGLAFQQWAGLPVVGYDASLKTDWIWSHEAIMGTQIKEEQKRKLPGDLHLKYTQERSDSLKDSSLFLGSST